MIIEAAEEEEVTDVEEDGGMEEEEEVTMIEVVEEEEDMVVEEEEEMTTVGTSHIITSNRRDTKDGCRSQLKGLTRRICHRFSWRLATGTKYLGESSSSYMDSAQRRQRTSDVSAQARRELVQVESLCTIKGITSIGSYLAS